MFKIRVAQGGKFVPRLRMVFYCPPPAEFLKTHWPTDKKWQCVPKPISRKEWEIRRRE